MRVAILESLILFMTYGSVSLFLHHTAVDIPQSKPVVKLHPAYLIWGILATCFFYVITILLAIKKQNVGSFILFPFAILSITLIIAYFNCRVFYDDTSITSRNFFGEKKTIFYSEVIDVVNGMDTIIKTHQNTVKIRNYMVGRFDLLLTMAPYLNSKLEKKTQRVIKKPAVRAFKDSVWKPGEFIFVYILLGGMSIVFLLMCVFWGDPQILWFPILLAVLSATVIFLSIHSAKRAHSSKFWNKVAHLCFKEGYLEP